MLLYAIYLRGLLIEASIPPDTSIPEHETVTEDEVIQEGPVRPDHYYLPWPPPQPSSSINIPMTLFPGAKTIGDIVKKAGSVLDSTNYEYSFLYVPDGCAIITRVERINEDATSAEQLNRYVINDIELRHKWSFREILSGKFTAPAGFFRVIVLIITDVPYNETGERITLSRTLELLRIGLNYLPRPIYAINLNDDTHITALIYEFRSTGFQDTVHFVSPGSIPPSVHIERAKLWRLTEK